MVENMENVVNANDVEEEKKIVLTKIELGSSYLAKINVLNYEFVVHIPTLEDDWNIIVKASNLMKGLTEAPGQDVSIMANVYATLDSVVDSITVIKPNGEKQEIKEKFWDWVKKKRNTSKLFSEMILPTFMEFKKFETELDISEDDLKK